MPEKKPILPISIILFCVTNLACLAGGAGIFINQIDNVLNTQHEIVDELKGIKNAVQELHINSAELRVHQKESKRRIERLETKHP